MFESSLTNIVRVLKATSKNKNFKYGLPFLILVVGGSFGLKEFTELRFRYRRTQYIRPEEMKEHGIIMKKPGEVTLESEYEKILKLDIENWENVRGPRPWEENVNPQKEKS